MADWKMTPIAYYEGELKEKFGIPRQARLVEQLCGTIVFEEAFADPQALRGLEGFSHLWVIWGFSANREAKAEKFQPTVRPPRLAGNQRMGVFATRSPYRPNPLGLSAVKIEKIEPGKITVSGADLLDGTPIFDIKPYLPYADVIAEAKAGFADSSPVQERLRVLWADHLEPIPVIEELLALDPRPAYQEDPERVYGMRFGDRNVKFRVEGDTLTVTEVEHVG